MKALPAARNLLLALLLAGCATALPPVPIDLQPCARRW